MSNPKTLDAMKLPKRGNVVTKDCWVSLVNLAFSSASIIENNDDLAT